MEELTKFKTKVTAVKEEEMLSWREREHDDLVLATAVAAWVAERVGSIIVGAIL